MVTWAMWIVGLPMAVARLARALSRSAERTIADEAEAWLSRQ